MLQCELFDTFLDIEKLCLQNDLFVTREKLVTSMFVQAVRQNEDAIALHMSMHFASLLLRSTEQVVPIILTKMQNDATAVNEIQLSILQRLQPRFHFRHADRFVQIIETAKSDAFQPDGNILRQSNPLMWLVLTIDLLMKLRRQFRSLALRINFVSEQIQEKFIVIYEHVYEPDTIETLLT